MINRHFIEELLKDKLEEKNIFITDIQISTTNKIQILLDSYDGIPISDCVEISKFVERNIDRDLEDYDLEVSSSGVTNPFKVPEQYKKNIGKEIEVVTITGDKYFGRLKKADTLGFELEETIKEKKDSQNLIQMIRLKYDETKYAKNIVFFKKQ